MGTLSALYVYTGEPAGGSGGGQDGLRVGVIRKCPVFEGLCILVLVEVHTRAVQVGKWGHSCQTEEQFGVDVCYKHVFKQELS